MEKREIFICACHSLEHQFGIWYDEEDNQLFIEPHLTMSGNRFERFLGRLKYIFGHKSRYGAWDEVILNNDDIPKLKSILEKIEQVEINKVANRGRD